MTPNLPGVSVVMPTLNASRYLDGCLASIAAQDYPRELIEILVVDAGSTDATLDICRQYGVDRILPNPKVTGEAAKAVGIRAASREVIAFIDSDNYLVGTDWLRRLVAPFADPSVFASDPVRWNCDPADRGLNRYFSMGGFNDPAALFIGNYAYESAFTGRWTGLHLPIEQHDGFVVAELSPGKVPVLGSNGFMIRTKVVQSLDFTDYYFDVDEVAKLVALGYQRVAKVDAAIGHYFVRDLRSLVRKTRRRIEDFLYWRDVRTYPWLVQRRGLALFALGTVTTVPLVLQALTAYRRTRDWAAFYHVPACWVTLAVYAWGTLRSSVVNAPHSREQWSH